MHWWICIILWRLLNSPCGPHHLHKYFSQALACAAPSQWSFSFSCSPSIPKNKEFWLGEDDLWVHPKFFTDGWVYGNFVFPIFVSESPWRVLKNSLIKVFICLKRVVALKNIVVSKSTRSHVSCFFTTIFHLFWRVSDAMIKYISPLNSLYFF